LEYFENNVTPLTPKETPSNFAEIEEGYGKSDSQRTKPAIYLKLFG